MVLVDHHDFAELSREELRLFILGKPQKVHKRILFPVCPLTSPLKIAAWKMMFFFLDGPFSGSTFVHFREGTTVRSSCLAPAEYLRSFQPLFGWSNRNVKKSHPILLDGGVFWLILIYEF